MKNREKLAKMSNVELSIFISEYLMVECNECICAFKFGDEKCNAHSCAAGVCKWLEQEVEE